MLPSGFYEGRREWHMSGELQKAPMAGEQRMGGAGRALET